MTVDRVSFAVMVLVSLLLGILATINLLFSTGQLVLRILAFVSCLTLYAAAIVFTASAYRSESP